MTGPRPTRRDVLAGAVAFAALPAAAADGLPRPGEPFSFDRLTERMRLRAAAAHAEPAAILGAAADLDYDGYRRIRFRDDRSRWTRAEGAFRLQAFHAGWLFNTPVQLFDVTGGTVEPIGFSTDDFDYGDAATAPPPGQPVEVAGFRLLHPLNRPGRLDEVLAFLGASYFRALGRGSAYGASARGLALNTATEAPEEFPRFSAFYLEQPVPGADRVTFHAALESASVAGAFRFEVRPGDATVLDVTARLFFRRDVAVLGVAPLTSMFLYDEKNRAAFDDYRPQVHDSCGLRMLRADGDALWRPLNNPPRVAESWFRDSVARFGLHQRDRDFAAFQDAEARYERRPSVEVEPLGDWGPGAVRLVELPADREIHDNIVVAWVGAAPGARAGESREYRYRLHWGDLPDAAADAPGHVVATRAGVPGVSGRVGGVSGRKFVVDFAGGRLAAQPADAPVRAVVAATGAEVDSQVLMAVPEAGIRRLVLDMGQPAAGVAELTAHLAGSDRKLTETWLYQWIPA